MDFVKRHGEVGLKTFLSLEFGEEMGEKILDLGEKINGSEVDRIFARYSQIVSLADQVEQELRDRFENIEANEQNIKDIARHVLKKANCLLENFSSSIEHKEEIDEEQVLSALDDYNSELIFSLGVLRSFKDKIEMEDLEGVSFEKKTAGVYARDKEATKAVQAGKKGNGRADATEGVLADEISQMFSIYRKNWQQYPEKFQNILLEGYGNRLLKNDKSTRIYQYKKDDKLMAFLRIDDIAPGRKYFGSFNALDSVKGGRVGEALLSKALAEEGKDSDIEAVCAPQEDVLAWYINKHGFIGKGIDMDYHGTGQPMIEIERSRERGENHYDSYEKQTVIEEYERKFSGNQYKDEDKEIILKFSVDKNKRNSPDDDTERMNQAIADLSNKKGLAITRSMIDVKGRKKDIYLCFESLSGN
ncbi:hypothetical protein GF382_01885 [Candidatus Falkowbacteria bacterium]|nr:hypothetical protein [Candidatus Falkowbacteria bacterium]